MHTWPALRNLCGTRIFTAWSMSASSHTITGAWPPSSIVARFISEPARAANCLPTATEPVKEILRTMGECMRCVETSEGTPHTMFKHPGGSPASWHSWAMATTALGASSGPLRIIVQPAPSAAVILRMAWLKGKFHGENAAHTPTGSRSTNWRTPCTRGGMTRP